jgi:hypothetical protein
MRTFLFDVLPKNSIGLEIGVWKGEFSEQLKNNLSPIKLYLNDPWIFISDYPDRWYGGSFAKNQDDMDMIYLEVCNKFLNNQNIEILRCNSNVIGDFIPKNTLDWVYIDGNHSFDFVLSDLNLSMELVKDVSYIVGDDYFNSIEVKNAVDFFVESNKKIIINFYDKNGQFVIEINK